MAGHVTRWSVWLGIGGLVLVASLADARADDRARQRTEARTATQYEKFEAWQEEMDSELDELLRRAGNLRRSGGRRAAEEWARQQYEAQEQAVKIVRGKGSRLLSRIRRACQQMAERWPPEPPECQEELHALVYFLNRTLTRQSEAYDSAVGR